MTSAADGPGTSPAERFVAETYHGALGARKARDLVELQAERPALQAPGEQQPPSTPA